MGIDTFSEVLSIGSILLGLVVLSIFFYQQYKLKRRFDFHEKDIRNRIESLEEAYERKYLAKIVYQTKAVETVRDSGHISPRIKFEDVYVTPFCEDQRGERFRFTAEYVLGHKDKDFIIVGSAGSGKTSLLQFLSLSVSEDSLDSPRAFGRIIPFYISLKTTQHFTESSLLKLCTEFAPPTGVALDKESYWQKAITTGRALFLFDGLDEIQNDRVANRWLGLISEWSRNWGACQYVITSRPERLSNISIPPTFELTKLKRFTDGQITEFIKKWTSRVFTDFSYIFEDPSSYQQNKPALRSFALEHIILSRPELNELAGNPLLLTLMCATHYFTGSIPINRTFIIREVVSLLIGKLDYGIPKHELESVLEQIAFELVKSNKTAISPEQLQTIIHSQHNQENFDSYLEWILRSGLFREVKPYEFSFTHYTFQEFFAARYILNQDVSSQFLVENLTEYRWRDVVLLSVESMKNVYEFCHLILNSENIKDHDKIQLIGQIFHVSSEIQKKGKQMIVERIVTEIITPQVSAENQQALLLASPYISSLLQEVAIRE